MAQKQDGPGLDIVPLNPDRLKQLVRLANECVFVFPVYGRRVILVKEDSCIGDILGKIVAEPEASLRSSRRAPCIPGVSIVVLATRIQAVDGEDAISC